LPTGLRHFPSDEGSDDRQITALYPTPNRLWIGRNGIQYYDSTGFQRPVLDDPTRGQSLTTITQDGAPAPTNPSPLTSPASASKP
jgi:hypothetical protein